MGPSSWYWNFKLRKCLFAALVCCCMWELPPAGWPLLAVCVQDNLETTWFWEPCKWDVEWRHVGRNVHIFTVNEHDRIMILTCLEILTSEDYLWHIKIPGWAALGGGNPYLWNYPRVSTASVGGAGRVNSGTLIQCRSAPHFRQSASHCISL